MNKKKIMTLVLSTFVLGATLMTTSVFASDDKWSFTFTINPYQSNSRSAAKYRQTKSTENPWKVCLEKSSEGQGTYTRFWLELSDGKNVSTYRDVKQGSGPVYTGAYSDASQQYVNLTAENNNYNAYSYNASGFWDEETW